MKTHFVAIALAASLLSAPAFAQTTGQGTGMSPHHGHHHGQGHAQGHAQGQHRHGGTAAENPAAPPMPGMGMPGMGMQGMGMMNCPMMQGMQAQAHGGHAGGLPEGDQSVASLALNAVNEKMHRDMAITFTGDADVDFARAMIAHHRGAVDMARVVLAFGSDPEIRELAVAVVEAQEEEIRMMEDWLAARAPQ